MKPAGAGLVALCLLLSSSTASGSKPRLRLEGVEPSRCQTDAVVEAHLTELELEGTVRRRPPSEYRLMVNGRELTGTRATRTISAREWPLHVALIIETAASYAGSLELLRSGTLELLGQLPENARVTLISYDWQARRRLSLGAPHQARAALRALEAGGDEAELALDEALDLGLRAMGAPAPRSRRALVLISDGMNRMPKREVFRNLGTRARTLRVPIHPVGFSPIDERGPLLNLGELAKRSGGTMRWARRASDLRSELLHLGEELGKPVILAFPLPGGCSAPQRIQVATGDLRSNPIELRAVSLLSATGGRGPVRLILFGGVVAGAAAGLLLLARFVARGSSRRTK